MRDAYLHTQMRERGVALVVTLTISVLIAGLAILLLQTATLERGTSKGVAEKAKADLAAQTAANAAIAQLSDNLFRYPDSATSWEKVNTSDGKVLYQGTTLYYREVSPELNTAVTASPLHALPLISGAQPISIPNPPQSSSSRELNLRQAFSAASMDDLNSYDLNRVRFSGDTRGAIGIPARSSSRPEFRGQWVNLTDSSDKVTARYAYWMEDESFKVNANYARDNLRGASTFGIDASEIPLQGLFKVIGNGDPDKTATALLTLRSNFPSTVFYEYRALNQVDGQPTLADDAKFETTVFSGGTNISRSGFKRVNLNQVVTTSTTATAIRKQLDEIIKAITSQLPNFGERFYRTTAVTPGNYATTLNAKHVDSDNPTNKTIYLNKIAANIRDYIDTDSQPTIINNDASYSVRVGTKPTNALAASGGGNSGPNEVIAIGKERVPFLQEYALRIRLTKFTPAGYVPIDPDSPQASNPGADYEFYLDHYFEFWNMTNKDITPADLGPNPFLLVSNQFAWDAGGGTRTTQPYINPTTDIPSDVKRDFIIPLSSIPNLVFKAGAPTVITTDTKPFSNLTPNTGLVFVATTLKAAGAPPTLESPDNYRLYSGKTFRDASSNPTGFPSKARALRINIVPRSTTQTDYETEVTLGNDDGLIESFEGLPIATNISVNNDTADRIDSQSYFFRGGSLRGNNSASPFSQTGDPRTNNEQLSVAIYNSSLASDQTRYVDSGLNNNAVPDKSSLTQLNSAPPGNNVSFQNWSDPLPNPLTPYTGDPNNAPSVIANSNLTSIGQIGDVFDAVRGKNASGSNDIRYSRGGGRTFKIGQPERYDASINSSGIWDGNSNSASREWTAWRLTDVFSMTDALQLDGRININGTLRDGGMALKTALYGYEFRANPEGDLNLAGKKFDADPTDQNDKISEMIKQVSARLSNDTSLYSGAFASTVGPFFERGEVSELPMFNMGTDLLSGVNTAAVMDRGREELVRRLIGLTTTRGNIFTVYVVGQALVPQATNSTASPTVTSTSRFKITFRIDPVWNAGTPSDPFDPTSNLRFAKPTSYAVKIIYAGE